MCRLSTCPIPDRQRYITFSTWKHNHGTTTLNKMYNYIYTHTCAGCPPARCTPTDQRYITFCTLIHRASWNKDMDNYTWTPFPIRYIKPSVQQMDTQWVGRWGAAPVRRRSVRCPHPGIGWGPAAPHPCWTWRSAHHNHQHTTWHRGEATIRIG
jgi:hypothetical protein